MTDQERKEMRSEYEAAMNAIDREEDIVLARLEERNGGPLPNIWITGLIEWAAHKFGADDPDVEQLAELESEYDANRDIFFDLDEDAADDEGDDE